MRTILPRYQYTRLIIYTRFAVQEELCIIQTCHVPRYLSSMKIYWGRVVVQDGYHLAKKSVCLNLHSFHSRSRILQPSPVQDFLRELVVILLDLYSPLTVTNACWPATLVSCLLGTRLDYMFVSWLYYVLRERAFHCTQCRKTA